MSTQPLGDNVCFDGGGDQPVGLDDFRKKRNFDDAYGGLTRVDVEADETEQKDEYQGGEGEDGKFTFPSWSGRSIGRLGIF